MNSAEIRSIFLKYFEKNNHEIVHSSSLIPENDPTLMFVNSGMVQFKNIFTGKEERTYNRAVTAQKCVRAGGKHNDLENVGYTARHHTFFEMLGNFSFGDYFKDTAIELSWNLITKEFGIDKKKLLVTVFDQDQDAYNLWKKISDLPDERIIKIKSSDNFWSMGDTGPCGPCSEIFYDHGDNYIGGPPGSKDEDGDRFIEIWNLVFMQYEQIGKNKRINLPKPSIDTGMGLERVTALLQNTNDNYKTDIFTSLINKSIEITNNDERIKSASHKVVADHLRSASFLISDGVLPSNEGRGYVLRRIMRRGMRHAHSLGNKDPVFHEIFPTLLNEMGGVYPELVRTKELIVNTLFNEETKFKQTIDNGLRILNEEINNSNNKIFSGEVAFKLYDTFGFPIDLTQDYLKNKGMQVDIRAFDFKMLGQKQRARKNWKGTGDISDKKIWFEITKTLEKTKFIGYDLEKTESVIKKIICKDKSETKIKEGDEAGIILDQTTFYGESGGQIGDTGFLYNDNFKFLVDNTTKIFGDYFIHWGKVIAGVCKIQDQITTSINVNRRILIRNNHSSTHLLHASLRKILGKHVSQKGSLVNEEKLRFDFSHNDSIDDINILKIEDMVNSIINLNVLVNTQILDHKAAIEIGAMALFGEKYGDVVRVVSITNNHKDQDHCISIELCGGVHVVRTGEIKKFKIINQSSVASGVRRIEAVTSEGLEIYIKNHNIKNANHQLKVKNEIDKYLNLLKTININKSIQLNPNTDLDIQLKEIKKIYNENKVNIGINDNDKNIKFEKIGEVNLISLYSKKYPGKYQKSFIDNQKNIHNSKSVILLVSIDENKVSIVIGLSDDMTNQLNATELVKIASAVVGGSGGGGRKDLAQAGGNEPENISKIQEALKNQILKLT